MVKKKPSGQSLANGELAHDQDDVIQKCQALIGYRFQNPQFLLPALTHSSTANHKLQSSERMEFLGDALLGAIVCEFLFHRFPSLMEGELTKIKSIVVSGQTCARISRQLGLESCVMVGKGMANASVPTSILGDVFEAIVAAIFLDAGWENARDFVLKHLRREVEQTIETSHESNFKSQLQHHAQKFMGVSPTYVVMNESGPDHKKAFQIAAVLGEKPFTPAWGKNKKQAQQRAASNALAELQQEPPPFTDGPPQPAA
jgi:ribonuclease III